MDLQTKWRGLRPGIGVAATAALLWVGGSAGLRAKASPGADSRYLLRATWKSQGSSKHLASWSLEDLGRLKRLAGREKDPRDGKVAHWEGVAFAALMDEALAKLPVEERANVDLVILKGEEGAQAMIPRAFTVKYPLILATHREKKSLERETGPVYSVVPWTSRPGVLREGVPLESFFVAKVSEIEFTNYRERYSHLYLKRRTDPAAVRGEKLFVQNCTACHTAGQEAKVHRKFSELSNERERMSWIESVHRSARGAPKLTERDVRSLVTYLTAHQAENGGDSKAGGEVSAPGGAHASR